MVGLFLFKIILSILLVSSLFSFFNEYTLLCGYSYLKDFEREYGQYDEKSKKFLRQFVKSLNEAIDGFDKISKDWVETYASLKAHKSDKEWVNRYFIIDLPK